MMIGKSFDHLTYLFLPQMRLLLDKDMDEESILRLWVSASNPLSGHIPGPLSDIFTEYDDKPFSPLCIFYRYWVHGMEWKLINIQECSAGSADIFIWLANSELGDHFESFCFSDNSSV